MSNAVVLTETFTNSISSEIEANSISHNSVKIKMLSAFLFRCAASIGATDAGYATIIFRNPQNYEGLLVYKSEKWYKVGTKLNLSANYGFTATVYINNSKCTEEKIASYQVYPSAYISEINITKEYIPEKCYVEPKPSSTTTSSSSGVGAIIAIVIVLVIIIAVCIILFVFRAKIFAKCKKEDTEQFQKI